MFLKVGIFISKDLLRDLITQQIEKTEDEELLDLIYKLLIAES